MNCLNCGEETKIETACQCSPTFCANCCQCGPNCEQCGCGAIKARTAGGGEEEDSDEETEPEEE